MSKGFAQVYILLAVLVLVVFGVAYSSGKLSTKPNLQPQISTTPIPVADDIANWKTYTDDSLGIYFKYPQNYSLKQTSAEQTIFSIESTDKSSFQLIIYKNPNNLSLKDYESKNTGESGMGPNVYYKDSELIKVRNIGAYSEIEAYYEKEEIRCFSKCGSYVWIHKDKIYKLTGSSQNKPDQKQILDQILSTFRFLDQNQAGEYQVSGSTTQDFTAKDEQTLRTALSNLSVSVGLMEGFPPGVQIATKDLNSCEEVRKILATLKFIKSFGECKKIEIPQNPSQPVSNQL